MAFVPPPYPYDRLDELKAEADQLPGGCIDLSIGTPCDPPPLADRGRCERERRRARVSGIDRDARIPASRGRMASTPIRPSTSTLATSPRASAPRSSSPARPTTSACGPRTATPSCIRRSATRPTRWVRRSPAAGRSPYTASRRHQRRRRRAGRCVCGSTARAIPTGDLVDLGAAARWGRARRVPVLSDECYVEFTWDGPPHTILESGLDGVVAVHSLSKRSNLAGVRAGFFAGDTRPRALPARGPQARRVHGARSRASSRRRRVCG